MHAPTTLTPAAPGVTQSGRTVIRAQEGKCEPAVWYGQAAGHVKSTAQHGTAAWRALAVRTGTMSQILWPWKFRATRAASTKPRTSPAAPSAKQPTASTEVAVGAPAAASAATARTAMRAATSTSTADPMRFSSSCATCRPAASPCRAPPSSCTAGKGQVQARHEAADQPPTRRGGDSSPRAWLA